MVIDENKKVIIDNGGNVADYLLNYVQNAEFGWYFYLTDEEITEFEKGSYEKTAEMKNEITNFIIGEYNYDITD